MTDPTQAIPTPDEEKQIVAGRYQLRELIGRGGSAEVWRAEDTSLDREVALKLVTVPHDEGSARAGDEARTLARLNHPGLVPVYDAGTDDEGRPWVVMELVEGETLSDTLKRGPLTSDRTAAIGASIAQALAQSCPPMMTGLTLSFARSWSRATQTWPPANRPGRSGSR